MSKPEKKQDQIIGAGGGGGGLVIQTRQIQSAPPQARTPTRTADNLSSTAFANILDLIGEGEIEGFPSARAYTRGTDNYNKALLKDVFLTNTPVLRASADVTNLSDTDYNFKGVTVTPRYGTNAQTYIPGFEASESVESVGLEVVKDTPITRQITNSNVDAVRVSVAVPRLEKATDEGDVLGTEVTIRIDVQYNGGGFTTAKTDTISGRTVDKYERDYVIELDGAFPVDIRVVRVSDDSTDQNVNPTQFATYTELIYKKLRYPNSALVGLRFQAEQFSSIPSRAYRIRGVKVKIPNNGTVDQETGRITYSGTWTGTFGAAQWTTCPAWILYNLLTNKRYGFGDHIAEAQLSKFDFYSASVYANEEVDAGLGDGTKEARFSCNANIQNQYEAYKLINDLCSVMRSQPFWSAGALTLSQDKPKDSSYLFNRSNVLEPGFSYAGSDMKTRHTVAIVSYLDLETREQQYEIVEDRDAIEKYGWVATQIKAFACTSRGQANRLGQWILFTENRETEVVSFSASIEAGTLVRPGSVIDVQDPVRANQRYGGRISSATASVVTVDNADDLPDEDGTLSVLLSDGTVETRDVSSRDGTAITVSSDFSSAPNANSVWIFQTDSIQTQQFRVLTVEEQDQTVYAISALKYDSSKYDHVERGFELSSRTITDLNPIPNPPDNASASEKFYAVDNKAKVKIIVSWSAVKGVPQYKVRYRADNDNWETLNVARPDVEILDTRAATYTIEIYSINSLGRQSSDFTSLSFNAIGKTAVPGDVQNLQFEATSDKEGTLKWDETVDLDVKHGGKVYIRHNSLTDGSASWSDSVDLIEAVAGSSTSAKIPLVEGEVFVKFADDGGRLSTNEVSVIIDLPDTRGKLLLQSRREDQDSPPFQGTTTDTFYSDEFDALTLASTAEIDDKTEDIDDWGTIDFLGDTKTSGEYAFATTLDLEGVFSLDLKRRFVTRGFLPDDLLDERTDNVDSWGDWDGDVTDKVNAKLFVRKTDDDPSGSPTWGNWAEFTNGTFKGRGFQFKTELTSSDTSQNILVDELGYVAEFERRTENSDSAIASGTGTKSVSFGNAFFVGTASLLGANTRLPAVGITAQNMQSGDYFTVSNVSGTGFDVNFFNSSDTGISRNFNWSAVGYGKAG
jgi:predicted phage tail protein